MQIYIIFIIKSTQIMKIINILREEINKYLLKEENWNFHHTSDDIKGYGKPYASDNRYNMLGRSTGHFGSGTYFSTYNAEYDRKDDIRKYTKDMTRHPEFIKVDNGVYRVDFDIYKNLYDVKSEKEGDILYTALRNLNSMFNKVTYNEYDLSLYYQIIYKNCKALGLKCPNYKDLIRMMQKYDKSDNIQSFSTYFMEYNGFNGVNVSGIGKYDNTTHGSVIYDLSKTSLTPIKLDKNIKGTTKSNGDTLSTDDKWTTDEYESSLVGDSDISISKIKYMDESKQKRIIKNFVLSGNLFDEQQIKQLNDNMILFYLRLIYNRKPSTLYVPFDRYLYYNHIIDLINEYKQYYWANYIPREYEYEKRTGLILLLKSAWENDDYPSDDEEEKEYKKNYLKMLLSYMKRPLTNDEKNYIDKEYYI